MTRQRQRRTRTHHGRAHVCGRLPLDGPEAVFREVSGVLAPYVERIPDGRTAGWDQSGPEPRFREHPSLEAVADGQAGNPLGNGALVRPRPGTDPASVGFGSIGYADAARESWRVFRRLRDEGAVPPGGRFQVTLPTPLTVITSHVAEGHAELEPAYEAALLGELGETIATVPHDGLAIEWDATVELPMLAGAHRSWFDDREQAITARLLRLGDFVPDDVPMGYHLCPHGAFADAEASDALRAGTLVGVVNRLAAGLSRPLNWLHLPGPPDDADDEYFGELAGLRLRQQTELYLELLHPTGEAAEVRRRLDAAAGITGPLGIAAAYDPRGHTPDEVRTLLRTQADVVGSLSRTAS